MLAIILGDVHLGKSQTLGKTSLGSNLNSRLADQLNLLDWTLEQAVEEAAGHIIITGDIFEEPKPHPSIIAYFISWLKKCQSYNVDVHLIAGNHDVFRTGFIYSSPLDIIYEADLSNVSIYKEINTIILGSSAFTFMPFRDRKSLGSKSNSDAVSLLNDMLIYELAGIPKTYKKVVVGHLALEGSIPIGDEIDDISNELFCPISMFTGYDYVWMGHVHKPQVLKKNNPYVSHIGSMDLSNFGETDHKKYIVVYNCLSSNKDFEIKYLPTRSLKKLSITVPKDTVDTTKYVLEEIEKLDEINKAIVKVEISLSDSQLNSVNKSDIEKFLNKKGAFNIAGISESKKTNIIKKDSNNTIDNKMDINSAIKRYSLSYVEDKDREKFIELAMDIYNMYKAEVKE
jgi:DNA repair exonuclease SbcCD nuclease subunit